MGDSAACLFGGDAALGEILVLLGSCAFDINFTSFRLLRENVNSLSVGTWSRGGRFDEELENFYAPLRIVPLKTAPKAALTLSHCG